MRRVLFVDPDDIEVSVVDGVVTFAGEIGTRNESRLIEELARRLETSKQQLTMVEGRTRQELERLDDGVAADRA